MVVLGWVAGFAVLVWVACLLAELPVELPVELSVELPVLAGALPPR